MNETEKRLRDLLSQQAADWFVENRGDRTPGDKDAFAAWLKRSPLHVEEYLGVAAAARDLRKACVKSDESLEAYLARPRVEEEVVVRPFWSRVIPVPSVRAPRRSMIAVVSTAVIAVMGVGFLLWSVRPVPHVPPRAAVTTLHFQTRHGEQLTQRLADNSVVHLNTDTSVSVRYDQTERLITLTSGQADFEVVHEPDRKFRVLAGPATAVAVGTNFDVRLEADAAVITVVEGRVAVGPSPLLITLDANSNHGAAQGFVQVGADQQIRVTPGQIPAVPSAIDARSATSWLQRQIVFEREPLERVAGEFNRYAPKPIEIDTPALRKLEISGVFATDDPEAFIAFLRSLEGVRVEVGRTAVHVSKK